MGEQIIIPRSKVKLYQKLIDNNQMYDGCGRDQVIEIFTARFDEHLEADIKVCNSSDGPWIDPVLFYNGYQVDLLEPDFELLGIYEFEYNGKTYIVELLEELDDNDIVAEITWCVADIRDALEENGYKPSDENVRKFLNSRAPKTLSERSTEEGSNILGDLCRLVDQDTILARQEVQYG